MVTTFDGLVISANYDDAVPLRLDELASLRDLQPMKIAEKLGDVFRTSL